jgi:hypothetical protein
LLTRVFPNQSFIRHLGARRAMRERIRPELEAYYGLCFERMCREALPRLYAREGVSAAFEVGEYWNREVQIDVVAARDDGWVDLGECRWGRVASLPRLAAELEAKLRAFPNPRGATIGRRLFLRDRPVRPPAGPATSWHSLADLYRA